VQIDYDVVHLRTSLVQLFVLLLQNWSSTNNWTKERFGGAPNGYPFAALELSKPQEIKLMKLS
jgi:hypothetical protein